MADNRGKRNKMIGVWCTPQEYDAIVKLAEKAGVSKGRFCRMIALGEVSQDGEKQGKDHRLKELLRELSAIGNNHNQIAKKANETGAINPARLDETRAELKRIGDAVLRELL